MSTAPAPSRRWLAIALFAALPWLGGSAIELTVKALHLRLTPQDWLAGFQQSPARNPAHKGMADDSRVWPRGGPALMPDEWLAKTQMLSIRGPVDTLIAGDSRVWMIGGAPFGAHGWKHFNASIAGSSPEEMMAMAMQVILTQPVRRIVVGVSFDNMTEAYLFEFATFAGEPAFRNPEIYKIIGNPESGLSTVERAAEKADDVLGDYLPVSRAGDEIHVIGQALFGSAPPAGYILADGRVLRTLELQTENGTWNRNSNNLDPLQYYGRSNREARYLSSGRLSPVAQQLFIRFLDWLRQKGIVCLLYETSRTEAYSRLIHRDSQLTRLETQWRDFFHSQTHGCTRFIDDRTLHSLYDERDFIDPVHFIGQSGERLSERLASELEILEHDCSQTQTGATP